MRTARRPLCLTAIERLRPGDLVLTHRGRLRPVLEVQRRAHRGPLVALRRRGCAATLWLAPEQVVATPLPALPGPGVAAQRARELRRSPTPSEQVLWRLLRAARLRYRFRRQHVFGAFVLDFYCPAVRLALEVDGAVHRDEEQRESDRLRQQTIEGYGVEFLRFWSATVEQHPLLTIERIAAAVVQREMRVERDVLWTSAGMLGTGDPVCHYDRSRTGVIDSVARGTGAYVGYVLSVADDESCATEVCTVRVVDRRPAAVSRADPEQPLL